MRPEQIESIEELYGLSDADLIALSRKVSFYHSVVPASHRWNWSRGACFFVAKNRDCLSGTPLSTRDDRRLERRPTRYFVQRAFIPPCAGVFSR